VNSTVPRPSGASRRGLAAEQEAREAADPPGLLELRRGDSTKADLAIDAGIEDDEIGRGDILPIGKGMLEQPDDRSFVGRIGFDSLGAAARRLDGSSYLVDFRGRPAGNDDMIALVREKSAERRPQTLFGTHSDDDGAWRAHSAASLASSDG